MCLLFLLLASNTSKKTVNSLTNPLKDSSATRVLLCRNSEWLSILRNFQSFFTSWGPKILALKLIWLCAFGERTDLWYLRITKCLLELQIVSREPWCGSQQACSSKLLKLRRTISKGWKRILSKLTAASGLPTVRAKKLTSTCLTLLLVLVWERSLWYAKRSCVCRVGRQFIWEHF